MKQTDMAIDYVDGGSSTFYITPLACGILSMWDMAGSGVNGIFLSFVGTLSGLSGRLSGLV